MRTCPTEHEEAVVFVEWLKYQQLVGRVSMFTHISNETPAVTKVDGAWQKNFATINRMKKEGVNPGIPDYIIILPVGKGIAFIELKAMDGKPRSDQIDWINSLNLVNGCEARVCYGAKECISFIEELL